jgi:class 3 adenylate cyclase
MEPRIQYAQTTDGVSIAFWTLGEGMPLVFMMPACHGQLEWHWPKLRHWWEFLAEKRKLVRYDRRGSGLSDREVTDYSLDALVLDIEAVVDRLGLERFALLGFQHMGPVAIAYSARHPDRVSHLVLWCSWARGFGSEWFRSPEVRGLDQLLVANWDLYTETVAHAMVGWTAGDEGRRMASFLRECFTHDGYRAFLDGAREVDVTTLLPRVRAPTLVLHRRQIAYPDVDVARGLAARIPDARLALLEGASIAMFMGNTDAVASAIDEFLGEGEEPSAPAAAPSGLVTILFTDMEGSTTLTQRLGDAKAQEVLRTHNAVIRDALKAHDGSEIKHTGDGIMASFASASRALECAIGIQRALAQHNESNPDTPIRVRIGLNAGEPVAEEEDLFGTAVQLAARIAAKAEGEEILVSDTLRGLVAGKGFLFSDRGDVALRGFEDPVRLYEVRWRE